MTRKGFIRPLDFRRSDIQLFIDWALIASVADLWPHSMITELALPTDTVEILAGPLQKLCAKLGKAARRKKSDLGEEVKVWSLTIEDAQVGEFYLRKRLFGPAIELAPIPEEILEAGRRLHSSFLEFFVLQSGLPMSYSVATGIVERYGTLEYFERVRKVSSQALRRAKKHIAQVEALRRGQIKTLGFEGTDEEAIVLHLSRMKLPQA